MKLFVTTLYYWTYPSIVLGAHSSKELAMDALKAYAALHGLTWKDEWNDELHNLASELGAQELEIVDLELNSNSYVNELTSVFVVKLDIETTKVYSRRQIPIDLSQWDSPFGYCAGSPYSIAGVSANSFEEAEGFAKDGLANFLSSGVGKVREWCERGCPNYG